MCFRSYLSVKLSPPEDTYESFEFHGSETHKHMFDSHFKLYCQLFTEATNRRLQNLKCPTFRVFSSFLDNSSH